MTDELLNRIIGLVMGVAGTINVSQQDYTYAAWFFFIGLSFMIFSVKDEK
jgi:hypothetical protein